MATYVNNLRLKEITTGDEDGTWGTSTNTNLELIADALGYATQASFASDANATTTIADGAADPARALYFKVTSGVTLSTTRVLTIEPNTMSRLMWIENATSGSQTITIKQGSGATVNIGTGETKIVYLDGAGAGAAVVDALANFNLSLTSQVAGTLPVANGGTGLTSLVGADIASATTVNLTAATGDVVVITGTTTTTAFTMTKGQQVVLIAAAAWPLTFHATTCNINGGANYTCAAGDRLYITKDDNDVIRVSVIKQNGTPLGVTAVANGGTGLASLVGADIASATTVDLTAATGNTVIITGTTTTTAFTMTKGQQVVLIADAAWPLTYHATTCNINGGASYTCAAGDRLYVTKDDDNVIRVSVTKQDGTSVVAASAGPSYEATASGTIANGDTIIVNADGTVSAVAGTGATASVGADNVFNSGSTSNVDSAYDESTDRLVVIYRGSALYAQVGQINTDGTITFGSQATVAAGSTAGSICYDASTSRMLICYKLAGDTYGYGVVGTVTGGSTNTIAIGTAEAFWNSGAIELYNIGLAYYASATASVVTFHIDYGAYSGMARMATITGGSTNEVDFGTEITLNSGRTRYLERGVFYDSDTERVVACYMDWDSSENGYARIISNPSGTTLQAETEYEFNNADVEWVAACYDTANDKGFVCYRDKGDSNYLNARVITIVGSSTNSLTYGTEVTIASTDVSYIDCTFDATAGKIVVIYQDNTANKAYINTGTISGTGASATTTWDGATEVVGSSGLAASSIIYDPDDGRTVFSYEDSSNSGYGTTNVYTAPYSNTNMTAENYIGISDGAYSSSATATIQVAGAVDDAQSSLTPGQTYYISFDGSLVLTPVDPSVTAGTAVAATKLIVKG